MSSFDEMKITGLDPDRPPQVRKESYIDLFFKLSTEAPLDWCEDFNALGRQLNPAAKIGKTTADCIDTYTNNMEKIPSQLSEIKQIVKDCNEQYLEKIKQKARERYREQKRNELYEKKVNDLYGENDI